ncbi:hypothetical protein [Saliphagus infecundisoli]|uniref:DUF8163 domain-containing protein n=1 Tax=Saliphagus infecundisoli TaxID=1849069 RepID=A0ABD5QDW7_9EURY|nr:hypothetical protein [Saliphagus infecundisoli]
MTPPRERRYLLGLAVVVAAYAVAVGPLAGIPAGLATAAVGYWLGTPYAVAAGHVLLLPIFPDGAHPLSVGLVEAGFLALLVFESPATPAPRRFATAGVAAAAGLGALAWGLGATQSVPVAAAVLLLAFGATVYGLHRYGLLATGGLTTTDTPTEP